VFYRLVYLIVGIYARLICRLRVVGREYIPKQGPFLVITNHLSSADPPLVVNIMPVNLGMTGMAAMKHRRDFFIGWMMDRAGAIWVRRGEADREALRQALDALASGRPVGLAPEGTRSKTGALIEGKSGVAFLALKAGVPILPIALQGTDKVFPRLRRLRRATVQARVAPLFWLPLRNDGSRGEHLQYCTDLIMTRLASMLPEAYRGVYSDHPLIAYWEQLDVSGTADRPEWQSRSALSGGE
jgi:1-acyl-sn-glycerol-3-phosphate acyltransferase